VCALAAIPGQAQFVQQGTKLTGSGPAGSVVYQGQSVALSADGNTAIFGGPNDNLLTPTGWTGAAWVYTRNNGTWSQQGAKLVGSGAIGGSQQGWSVALSADGNTAMVGGPFDGFSGAAWVFTRASNGTWTQQAKLTGTGAAGNAMQGTSVALSADGNTALIGGPGDAGGAGAFWVFTRASGAWSQQGNKLAGVGGTGLSQQGVAIAISADGNTAIVGGDGDNSQQGAAWVFTRSANGWTQQGGKLVGGGAQGSLVYQGHSVAVSADGNTALLGGYFDNAGVGAAWVFTRNTLGVWSQLGGKLVGANAAGPEMGRSVALSGDGTIALLGGPLDITGGAWVFRRGTNGVWVQQGNKLVGNGEQGAGQEGWSVALSGDGGTALVGGYFDNGGLGAVWAFGQPHFNLLVPGVATSAAPINFTVSALDGTNQLMSTYAGTVHFSSSDSAAVLPGDGTLTAGVGSFSATLKTSGSQTLGVTDTVNSGVRGLSNPIIVGPASGGKLGPVSVSPASGGAASGTLTFTYNDPKGYQDMGVLNVLINNFLDGRRACYVAYVQTSNTLYVVGDDGSTLSGGKVMSAAGTVANSQCTVSWGTNAVAASGNSLALTLTVGFAAGFTGNKIVYLAARDQGAGNSGWAPLGVWQAPGAPQTTTTSVVGVSPARGAGMGPSPFTFTFSDTKGFTELGVTDILIN